MTAKKKVLKFLSSPVLALSTLVLIAFLLVVGSNPWIKFGYQDTQSIFHSWFFLTVIIVLFVNLLLCVYQQVIRLLNRKEWPLNFLKEFDINRQLDVKQFLGTVRNYAAGKGYKSQVLKGTEIICWEKKRLGIWAAVIFHVGLIIICIGVFTELGFAFNGRIGMVPGQLFEDRLGSYLSAEAGPLHSHKEGAFSLYLHEIKMKYKQTGVFASADASLIESGTEVFRQNIAAGTPLRFKLWNVFFESFGYYIKTHLTIDDREFPLDVGLSTTFQKDYEKYSEVFRLDKTPYWLNIEFIPDRTSYTNHENRSYEPIQPFINLIVRKTENGKNEQIYQGQIPLGGTAGFDRAKLKFEEFYPWITLNAKMEPGLYIIYVGFVIGLTGLGLLYLWVPEYICVKWLEKEGILKVAIGGYKTKYKKEFQLYLNEFSKELAELLSKEDRS
ncbi:MAG: cytochrome c biogenesis protein ResB [Firmicutes bacterium]|nr:cytochrome c biogenesis protein ResB [Bacillota bacterium]